MFGKKAVFFGVICAMLVLALGACSFKTLVFDEDYPLEKSCNILFIRLITKSYNGIPVKTTGGLRSPFGYYSDWSYTEVVLPAGEAEFIFDLRAEWGNTIYTAEDIFFRYKFEPGKFYSLGFTPEGGKDEMTMGIIVYEFPDKERKSKDKKLLDFISFRSGLGSGSGPIILD